jgi:hypothetical protein
VKSFPAHRFIDYISLMDPPRTRSKEDEETFKKLRALVKEFPEVKILTRKEAQDLK